MTKPREQQDLEAEAERRFCLEYEPERSRLEDAFCEGARHKEAQLASELAAKDAEIARLRMNITKVLTYADLCPRAHTRLSKALADKAGKGD